MSPKPALTRTAQQLSSAMSDGGDYPGTKRTAWLLDAVPRVAVHHTAAKNERALETEHSLAGFAPFSKTFFYRMSLPLGNLPSEVGQ